MLYDESGQVKQLVWTGVSREKNRPRYMLSRPVQECHDLPSRTVRINAEFPFQLSRSKARRYLFLEAPEYCVIEDMVLRDIRERSLGYRLRCRLALKSP